MKYFNLILLSFFFFSCSETPQSISGTETYQLVSQTVEIKDTIYKTDSNGIQTAEIERINEAKKAAAAAAAFIQETKQQKTSKGCSKSKKTSRHRSVASSLILSIIVGV